MARRDSHPAIGTLPKNNEPLSDLFTDQGLAHSSLENICHKNSQLTAWHDGCYSIYVSSFMVDWIPHQSKGRPFEASSKASAYTGNCYLAVFLSPSTRGFFFSAAINPCVNVCVEPGSCAGPDELISHKYRHSLVREQQYPQSGSRYWY